MRWYAAALMLLLAASGCVGSGAAAHERLTPRVHRRTHSIRLTVVINRDIARGGRVRTVRSVPFHVTCPTTNVRLAATCQTVQASRSEYLGHGMPDCFGPTLRWSVTVRGHLDGVPVGRTYNMCLVPEARAWLRLVTRWQSSAVLSGLRAYLGVLFPHTPGFAHHADERT
jgi:hypothetical protein